MRLTVVLFSVLSVLITCNARCEDWAECSGLSDNDLRTFNCNFSDGVNHWTFDTVMGTWGTDANNGYPAPPCGQAEATDPGSYAFTITSECMPVEADTSYALGFYTRTPGGATIACVGRIAEFASSDCSEVPAYSSPGPFTPQLNTWTSSSVVWTTSSGVQSAQGVVECSADASFTVLFDNAAMVKGTSVPVELLELRVD